MDQRSAADENWGGGPEPGSWEAEVSTIWNMVPYAGPPPNWDKMTRAETDAYVEKFAIR